jgi:hypothetical protein
MSTCNEDIPQFQINLERKMSNSASFKVQSLALCLPLTLLLACGQNDSKKKTDAPVVQNDAPAEPAPAPAPAPAEPAAAEPAPAVPAPLPAPAEPTVEPAPVVPAPVEPTPVTPAPVEPEPAKPAPVKPAPVKPAPVEPAPSNPAQQAEIAGTSGACEAYDFTSFSFKETGSIDIVATFGADGTYKVVKSFFTDAECKVPFTQEAADRMTAAGAQFEEQELQDYLKGASFETSYKAKAIGANGLVL